ncbi:hypothetical protein D3C83_78890 [compost metagenome]
MQRPDNRLFRFAVNFRHVVVRRLFAHRHDVEIAGSAVDDAARAARRLDGDIEHRMHGSGVF